MKFSLFVRKCCGCMLLLALTAVLSSTNGCKSLFGQSNEPTANEYPAGYEQQCTLARDRAVAWFPKKWDSQPKVPYVRVEILSYDPAPGCGAVTPNAWRIRINKNQVPFQGSLDHEYRHALNLYNGKGNSEEATK